MCRERVAEAVRVHAFLETHFRGIAPHDLPKCLPRQCTTARARKEERGHGSRRPLGERGPVGLEVAQGHFAEGDEASFLPFSERGYDAPPKIDVSDTERDELRNPEPRGIREAQHRAIAKAAQ